jgi:hypothetical protein
MPTPTYTPLATVTLGSSASSVTFSNIPATYRDLIVVFNGGCVSGVANMRMSLNGNTTDANYSGVRMDGTGSGTESGTLTAGQARFVNYYGYLEANLNGNIIIQVMDYSATDKHKTYLSRANHAANGVSAVAGRFASTSAVTSVMLDGADFRTGSTFNLFGISA